MPPELKARVEQSAKKNNRSLNAEVVFWLQKAMDDADLMTEAGNPREQTDAPVSSAPPRKYTRKQKVTLQTDIPEEDLQELIAHLRDIWAKNTAKPDDK